MGAELTFLKVKFMSRTSKATYKKPIDWREMFYFMFVGSVFLVIFGTAGFVLRDAVESHKKADTAALFSASLCALKEVQADSNSFFVSTGQLIRAERLCQDRQRMSDPEQAAVINRLVAEKAGSTGQVR